MSGWCAPGRRHAGGQHFDHGSGFAQSVSIGLDIADASKRVSTYAADFLGLSERGRLQANTYADMVVLDRALNLIAVYIEGEKIDLENA